MHVQYAYSMPSSPLHTDQSQGEVLSRVAQLPGLGGRFSPLDRARNLYRNAQPLDEGFRLENLLAEMRIDLRVSPVDQARIPARGPVVVVANHPYGVLDDALLTGLLRRVRSDVKVLTNYLLADVPGLHRDCIFVDPFDTNRSAELNRKAARDSLEWLQKGGMLAIFPAGEVSQWQLPPVKIAAPEWNDTAVRLIRRTGAMALPTFFCGYTSFGFQLLGMIHPKLRTALLVQEFRKQEGRTIEVRVGSPVSADAIACLSDNRQAIDYLRWRTYLLARRSTSQVSWPSVMRSHFISKIHEPVAAQIEPARLKQEIAELPAGRCLAENADFAVYLGRATELPNLLLEVGRLREVTFRGVGEGTGKARDLDSFDDYYFHILLWNKSKQELVGAYRAGNTAEIIASHGIEGLYTSTLFRFDTRLFEKIGPAFELVRSFVRPEYQRQYAPLLLLWKGIARFVAMHPEIPVLFGAVSISNDYNRASREMIFRFFESQMENDELAGYIVPRRKFRPTLMWNWDCRAMCRSLRDLEQLSEPIADVESDGKGLPILLKQYARIGGKLLGFNVDRKFCDVLDGLVLVDLRQTDPAVLERYMGKVAAVEFRRMHCQRATAAH